MLASPIVAPWPTEACFARPQRRRVLLALAAVALVGPFAGRSAPSHATPGLDRMQQLAAERYGAQAQALVAAWRQLLEELAQLETFEQLTRVNTFFNRRIRFESDIDIWSEADHWATPLETMGRGAGDCEDFTIAKYMTLQLAGVPNERLRLIYVRAQIGRADSGISQAHMVLGYYPEPTAEPMILDNLVADIRAATRRPDLVPVFSFNSEGLWVGGASASSIDPTARLSRWRDVLQRMREQGLT